MLWLNASIALAGLAVTLGPLALFLTLGRKNSVVRGSLLASGIATMSFYAYEFSGLLKEEDPFGVALMVVFRIVPMSLAISALVAAGVYIICLAVPQKREPPP